MADEVKLHGFWPSPFSHRVIWALRIKGVNYDYTEEDLPHNKSELLLKYNPVYKQIPVLVHGGKPIAESLIILEYIEDTWPQNPLLPTDPYEKALARFWIKFAETMSPPFRALISSTDEEEQEKAAKEVVERLKTLEEKALGDKMFFGGDAINMVDIAYGLLGYWLKNVEIVLGMKLLDPNTLPRLCEWAENFMKVPVIQENLPDRDKLLAYLRIARERFTTEPQ
ncbi:hypothetical protein SLA2020_212180 [Shorea laevis]